MHIKTIIFAAALSVTPGLLHAQFDFKIDGRSVQVHSFASQGFLLSNHNNYLTMKTSDGSFAMTDGGANVSMQITDKLRVGAQFYIRNVGNLGNFHPEVDWAVVDYRFASWFGIRAGRVKTALGLYNDTQDLEFLHTWALLPQSAYPLDLRASTISHTGGDFYGTVGLKALGSASYTAYAGSRADDKNGGYRYGLAAPGVGILSNNITGHQVGGDLRWNTPVKGLLAGFSYMTVPSGVDGKRPVTATFAIPIAIDSREKTRVFYGEYKTGGLTVAGEYRRQFLSGGTRVTAFTPGSHFQFDARSWWASAAYRISSKVEVGTYHSRFYPSWPSAYHGGPGDHLFDQVATARVDINRHWDVKVEAHFIDGYGSLSSFRGFYPQDNPSGFKPKTTMMVIRTGWNF